MLIPESGKTSGQTIHTSHVHSQLISDYKFPILLAPYINTSFTPQCLT